MQLVNQSITPKFVFSKAILPRCEKAFKLFIVSFYQGCGVEGKTSNTDLSKISNSLTFQNFQLRLSKISDSNLSKYPNSDSNSLT